MDAGRSGSRRPAAAYRERAPDDPEPCLSHHVAPQDLPGSCRHGHQARPAAGPGAIAAGAAADAHDEDDAARPPRPVGQRAPVVTTDAASRHAASRAGDPGGGGGDSKGTARMVAGAGGEGAMRGVVQGSALLIAVMLVAAPPIARARGAGAVRHASAPGWVDHPVEAAKRSGVPSRPGDDG